MNLINMQKSSVQVTVHFRNLKFQNTGNQMKELQRKFNSSKGSFKLRRRNLFKSEKNVENFADVQRYALFKLILHAKAKALVYADRLWSHFNARGFTNRPKSLKIQRCQPLEI